MLLLNKQRMHFIVYLQSTFSGFRSGISPFLLSFVAPHWTLQWFSRIGFGPTYMLVVGKLDAIHLRSISQPDTATAFSQLNYYNMGAGVLAALTVTVLWEFVRTLYSPSNLYRHIKELRVFLLYGTLSLLHLNRLKFHNYCLNLTLVDLQLSLSYGGAAESEGFEPPVRCRTTVFKTVTINRSDNSPYVLLLRKLQQVWAHIEEFSACLQHITSMTPYLSEPWAEGWTWTILTNATRTIP